MLSNSITKTQIPAKDSADEPAAHVVISKRAKQVALAFTNDGDNSLNLDEDFLSSKQATRLKQASVDILTKPTGDPFEDDDLMRRLQYEFSDYSPEYKINNILKGRAKNASVVTNELSKMLRQTLTNKDASITERAETRETAIRCAEYIADRYFDNPDEAKAFMLAIHAIYEEDVATDKGYIVSNSEKGTEFINPNLIQTGSGTIEKDLAFSAYCRSYCNFHGKRYLDVADIGPLFDEYINISAEAREKWAADERKEFTENERIITETIKEVKLSYNNSLLNNSIVRLLKAF